jgi:hypothetical protein
METGLLSSLSRSPMSRDDFSSADRVSPTSGSPTSYGVSSADRIRVAAATSEATSSSATAGLKEETSLYEQEVVEAVDGEGMKAAALTIHSVILPVVCVFGILGIILTLVVLTRKTMRTSTNCYLIALSVADLIFLVLLGSKLAVEHCFAIQDSRVHSVVMIYGEYAKIVTNIALMASVWMTASVSCFCNGPSPRDIGFHISNNECL